MSETESMKSSFADDTVDKLEELLIQKFGERLTAVELTWHLVSSGEKVVRRYEFAAEDAA